MSTAFKIMKVYEKNRAAYRKIKGSMPSCIFCDPENIEEQSVKKLEGTHWYVFTNKYPYIDGNLMLVPKRHVEQVEDLNAEERSEFFEIYKKAKDVLGKLFETESFNCGINIGPESGCSIPHIHWQMLPRRKHNSNCTNIIHDIHIITMDYKDLINEINKII